MKENFLNFTQSSKTLIIADCNNIYTCCYIQTITNKTKNSINKNQKESLKIVLIIHRQLKKEKIDIDIEKEEIKLSFLSQITLLPMQKIPKLQLKKAIRTNR